MESPDFQSEMLDLALGIGIFRGPCGDDVATPLGFESLYFPAAILARLLQLMQLRLQPLDFVFWFCASISLYICSLNNRIPGL